MTYRGLIGQAPRLVLASAALALSACQGGSAAETSLPPAAPTSSPTPSPGAAPSPSAAPTASTVCGSAFQGRALAEFDAGNCSSNNAGCTNTGAASAIDNNRDTAAVMTFSGAGARMVLHAHTQSGTVVPAGRMAGALMSIDSQMAVSTALSFATYLGTTLQETGGQSNNTASPSTNTTPNFHRFVTTKPYDRIDVIVEQSGSVTTKVFEICSE